MVGQEWSNPRGRVAVVVVGFAMAAAVGDALRLPFPYVPPSLRLLPAIVAGALVGARRGALSQGLFAAASAAAVLVWPAPPDLGYRLALPLCAALVGWFAGPERKATRGRLVLAGLVGLAVLDAVGVAILAWLLPPHLPEPITVEGLLRVGVLFPLPWDLAQVALAAFGAPYLRRRAPWLAFPEKSL